MANNTASNLLRAQARFTGGMIDGGEFRPVDTAALSQVSKTAFYNPELAEMRGREDRPTSGYFSTRTASDSASGRVAEHTGTRGDSEAAALTFDTRAEKFSISAKQLDNNVIDFAEAFARRQQSAVMNLLDYFDAWYITQLTTNLTQVNNSPLGKFNAAYVEEMTDTEKSIYFAKIVNSMKHNRYNGELQMIGDTKASVLYTDLINQGQGNSKNTQYQFGRNTFNTTTRDLVADTDNCVIAHPAELVGVIPWIPPNNRNPFNAEKAMTVNGDFSSFDVPIYDSEGRQTGTLPIALSMYTKRSDASGSNGSAQDLLIQGEVSLDLGFTKAPKSDFDGSNSSVIFGYGLTPEVVD